MVLAALIILAIAPLARAADRLDLSAVGDPELSRVLSGGFNLPTLMAAAPLPDGVAAAALAVERARLAAMVRAFGYLDAMVEVSGAQPGAAVLRPVPGPLYHVGAVTLGGVAGVGDGQLQGDLQDLIGASITAPASRDVLSRLENAVLRRLQEASHLEAKLGAPILADRPSGLVRVDLDAVPGPAVRFGAVSFTGLKGLDPALVQGLLPFAPGDAYDPAKIETLYQALMGLPLVRGVRIGLDDAPDAAGVVPVSVAISESSDGALLAHFSDLGKLVCALTLGMLALRQISIAGGLPVRSPLVLAQTIAVAMLLAATAGLVAQRAASFASLG